MTLRSFFCRSQSRQRKRPSNHDHAGRRLRFEALEDRALLAITVNTLTDELDGSIVDGDISLRDAIAAAPVGETINFSVTGAINLTLGQLTIGRNLTVTGPGANQLKIDAGGASRVLEITAGTVGVSGLTLTGGNSGSAGGGVLNSGNTTLIGVAVEGNTGFYGGGAYNALGALTIVDSTISGNSATFGGGVYNFGFSLAIKNSTISGNSATTGGGVVQNSWYASTTIAHSTITGNSAHSAGGGIASLDYSNAWLSHTLITGNSADIGSEIYSHSSAAINLNAFNLIGDSSDTTAQALFGVTAGATDILATSNGTNPTALAAILGPLANNGGSTKTHALVTGSPAINAGDPAFMAPPSSDQRGATFVRVAGGRLDIGAFEAQTAGPALLGDYNLNSVVDAADYVVWRKMLNQPVAPYSGADGDGDGTVDHDDYGQWREHFGQTAAPQSAGNGTSAAAEISLSSLQVGDEQQAVEVRGASENQRAKMSRESAIVDLAAPLAKSRAKFRHILGTSSAATTSFEGSRRNSALLSWLSQADFEPAIGTWLRGKMVEFDQTSEADDSVLESVDQVFAQIVSDLIVESVINSASR